MRYLMLGLMLLVTSLSASAVVEDVNFDTPQLEQRYKELIAEFRCLVCQNQNLADSNAELAKDLRRKTAEMLSQGSSNDDIRQYMRDRYGDFISYRPAFNSATALLWLGPFILLFSVVIGLIRNIRRRQNDEALKPAKASDEARQVKVRNLLRDAPDLSNTPNKPTRDN